MSKSVFSVSESQFVDIVCIVLYHVTQHLRFLLRKSPESEDAK